MTPDTFVPSQSPLSTFVLCLFGVGITIGTFRLLLGVIATANLVRKCRPIHDASLAAQLAALQSKIGLRKRVTMYQTDSLSTAATLGLWRPCILLPVHWKEWTSSEKNAVLAHELAHISHGDFAAVLISQLGVVFHFYHPLVHRLSGRMRLEQELAADYVAAQLTGGRGQYVRVLAKLALEHQDRFVGWPARAFLPTRHTFLRRLEMLKDGKLNRPGSTPVKQWVAMAAIVMASIVLVGLKPPPNRAVAQDSPVKLKVKLDAKDPSGRGQFDLRYFSDDGGLVVAVRPAELLASISLTGLSKQIQSLPMVSEVTSALGIDLNDVEQVLVAVEAPPSLPKSIYVRSLKPIRENAWSTFGKPSKLAGADILESPSNETCVWKPDNRSIVLSSKRNVERWIQGRQVERRLTEADPWKKLMDRPLIVMVMILPFIEQNALYQEYRFDETWDGPNNIKLLAKMPDTYRHPDSAPASSETSYTTIIGEDAFCQPSKLGTFTDIRDGTSNTIMLVESKTSIPWTKPEDLEYASDKALPAMGGFSDAGFNVALADGSVRFLGLTMKETMLRSLITPRGGEVETK